VDKVADSVDNLPCLWKIRAGAAHFIASVRGRRGARSTIGIHQARRIHRETTGMATGTRPKRTAGRRLSTAVS
jgi:hypothetical protein